MILSLGFLFCPWPAVSATTGQTDLLSLPEPTCFGRHTTLNPASPGTIKVEAPAVADLIFVQQDTPLPYRVMTYGSSQVVPFTIAELQGADATTAEAQRLVGDSNPETGIAFDIYERPPYVITLDLGSIAPADSLRFDLRFQVDIRCAISSLNKAKTR